MASSNTTKLYLEMKTFTDLNLSESSLGEKAASLGFVASALSVVFLPSKSSGDVAESHSVDLLVKACKQRRFFVVNPLPARDFYKSDALLAIAKERSVVFEIPVSFLLKAKDKARLMFQLRLFLPKCIKHGVKFFFSSRARNEFDLKSPREIIALGQVLGLTYQQAAASISLSRGDLQ